MASEISAPFAIRGVQSTHGNATASAPVNPEQRSATARSLDQGGMAGTRQRGTEAPIQESGKALPSVETERTREAAEVAGASKDEQLYTELKSVAHEMKDYFKSFQRNLQFEVDEESNRTIVRVVDSETGDVVRQIPAEEFLRMARRMEDLNGLLMSERA